jgi:hypothetical protein
MAYESVDMDGHRRMLVADHRVRDRASADQERRYRAPDLRFRDLLWTSTPKPFFVADSTSSSLEISTISARHLPDPLARSNALALRKHFRI